MFDVERGVSEIPKPGKMVEFRVRRQDGEFGEWREGYFKAGYDYKLWVAMSNLGMDQDLVVPAHNIEFREIKRKPDLSEKPDPLVEDIDAVCDEMEVVSFLSSEVYKKEFAKRLIEKGWGKNGVA